MNRRRLALSLVAAIVGIVPSSPAAGGDVVAESKNFRLIDSVTLGGVAVSGQVVGDTYFVSSWHTGLYSYDVSDPEQPELLDHTGADEIQIQSNENEDNGHERRDPAPLAVQQDGPSAQRAAARRDPY